MHAGEMGFSSRIDWRMRRIVVAFRTVRNAAVDERGIANIGALLLIRSQMQMCIFLLVTVKIDEGV